jgi:predicted dehydrogenase
VIDDYRRMEIFDRKKETLKSNQDKGFDAEIEAFAASVLNGAPPPIPLAELIETSLVTFAIHESLNTGDIVSLDDYTQKLGLPLIR